MLDHAHDSGTEKTVHKNLLLNISLTVLKFIAFAVTGSSALFGEMMHSIADSCNPLLLWIGVKRGRKPADALHPRGHDRERFVWSAGAAVMMLAIGSLMTYARAYQAIKSDERPRVSLTSLVIMALALISELYMFLAASKKIQKLTGRSLLSSVSRSADTAVTGVLLENGADTLAVLMAIAGYGLYILTGNPVWDAAFSFVIATLVLAASVFLFVKNVSLLTGEAAPAEIVERVRQIVRMRESVAAVRDMSLEMRGANLIDCRLTVSWKTSRPSSLNKLLKGSASPHLIAPAIQKRICRESETINSLIRKELPEYDWIIFIQTST